jgi:hypothetical protein
MMNETMNWKGKGRKRPWPNLRYYHGNLPGGTQENHQRYNGHCHGSSDNDYKFVFMMFL